MFITIWRHGIAGQAIRDRDRALTEEGKQQMGTAVARYLELCRGVPAPTRLLHSPWLRTTQTAETIAAATGLEPHSVDWLMPGQTPQAVEQALEKSEPDAREHVVLVSHQPLVSHLVDRWLGERGRVPSAAPGGFCCLEMAVPMAGCAELSFWAVPPNFEGGK